jgi:hypothetical protein
MRLQKIILQSQKSEIGKNKVSVQGAECLQNQEL